jgi:hypothetical protein
MDLRFIEEIVQKKNVVQIVHDSLVGGGVGHIVCYNETFVMLKPHTNEEIIKEFGEPTPYTILIPTKNIKLIMILT